MRIVVLINGLGRGGAERMLWQTIHGLSGADFQFKVYCLTRGGEFEAEIRNLDVEVEKLRSKGVLNPRAFKHLFEDLRRSNLLHTHLFYSDFLGSIFKRFMPELKIVTTRHDTGYWMSFIHRRLESKIYPSFSKVICVSKAVQRAMKNRGVNNCTFVTIPPGIEAWPQQKTTLPIPKNKPFILSVGRLEEVKNHISLLQSFAQLAKRDALGAWRLVIVGSGSQKKKLQAFVQKEKLSRRCFLIGELSPVQVRSVMQAASLFVLPSHSEALPLSLLEAMFCGKACIATDVGGVTEVIRHRDNGLLVPPNASKILANAMQGLMSDPLFCAQLAKQGQKDIQSHYNLDLFLTRMREVYCQCREYSPGQLD